MLVDGRKIDEYIGGHDGAMFLTFTGDGKESPEYASVWSHSFRSSPDGRTYCFVAKEAEKKSPLPLLLKGDCGSAGSYSYNVLSLLDVIDTISALFVNLENERGRWRRVGLMAIAIIKWELVVDRSEGAHGDVADAFSPAEDFQNQLALNTPNFPSCPDQP